ncbi:MAG: hypothetical protein K2M23_03015, partial [Alphaproteobacteria bacterium]|nr:hypothetical protein [Alphaproteobacteria bacterium]
LTALGVVGSSLLTINANADTIYMCKTCKAGTYANNNKCETCPAGSYCIDGVKYACPNGTYNLNTGSLASADCKPCSNKFSGYIYFGASKEYQLNNTNYQHYDNSISNYIGTYKGCDSATGQTVIDLYLYCAIWYDDIYSNHTKWYEIDKLPDDEKISLKTGGCGENFVCRKDAHESVLFYK